MYWAPTLDRSSVITSTPFILPTTPCLASSAPIWDAVFENFSSVNSNTSVSLSIATLILLDFTPNLLILDISFNISAYIVLAVLSVPAVLEAT